MIIREFYKTRNDGVNLYRTCSDRNVYIRKVGTDETFVEAIDIENAPFVYEETNEKIVEVSLSDTIELESEVEV